MAIYYRSEQGSIVVADATGCVVGRGTPGDLAGGRFGYSRALRALELPGSDDAVVLLDYGEEWHMGAYTANLLRCRADGTIAWVAETPAGSEWCGAQYSDVDVADARLDARTDDGAVLALDATTGRIAKGMPDGGGEITPSEREGADCPGTPPGAVGPRKEERTVRLPRAHSIHPGAQVLCGVVLRGMLVLHESRIPRRL